MTKLTDYVKSIGHTLPVLTALLLPTTLAVSAAPLPKLKVSDNQRFLVTESGEPFFWLGDTAWELFHSLNREDAELYLKNRAKLGFNVVQAVALAELHGLTAPNAYGHLPLKSHNPLQPSEDYFKHVDWIVAKANSLGIYVGFLPTWGDKWNKKWGAGPEIFTPQNAEAYGAWIGKRYQDAGIVWILGGDRPVETDTHKEILRAMARGLRQGDGGAHLITFHPTGGSSSSGPFQDEDWLDFHMRQNGHQPEFTGRYDQTRADYDRKPAKPVLDGEPIYEGHPVSFDAKKFGHSVAADVRRPFYWDVFTGGFGHTYGHHSVWSMHSAGREPVNSPLMPWTEAINEPGAFQVGIGKRLIESRPFLTRVPDDTVLVPTEYPTLVPGAGTRRFAATRDESGSYAMVYVPVGREFIVRLDKITGPQVQAWWFNPRDGKATAIGTFENQGEQAFTPPTPGELLDWVLVLDDAVKGYPQPGTGVFQPK
ncbi:MAG: glycoside hydrolase family 140 protein [Planctomycetota bacterium]|nr:glycoside hydrolase family 140 protein [Planctomycetota bacterium]